MPTGPDPELFLAPAAPSRQHPSSPDLHAATSLADEAEPGSGSCQRPLRLVIVTNIPAPYRVPVYNRIAAIDGILFRVIYAANTEPDRQWDLPPFEHDHLFLDGRMYERSGRFIHYNPQVWDALREFDPDVVVTTGYNPTHILAFLYTRLYGRRHVAMTDGTDSSEARLSVFHRLARRIVFAGSKSFVVASQGGWRLLRSYRVRDSEIHFSPLCANTAVPWPAASAAPDIDLLYSGRLVESKNAAFALQVAQGLARRLGRRVSLALLGSGPLAARLQAQADGLRGQVDVQFAGNVSQAEIPRWFQRARLFLFPTRWDPWGVVANEACSAGVPVLVSPHAGVAGELVRDGVNGWVLPLELPRWVDAAAEILLNPELHRHLAEGARASAEPYSFDNAAAGIVDAARQAMAPATALPRLSHFHRRPRVVCVQRRLTHYRVPFFEQLRLKLTERGIDFALVHGQAAPSELSRKDGGHVPWALEVATHYGLGERVCWQNLAHHLAGCDLVILTQENRLLYNLLATSLRHPSRLAFWGHGRNFQSAHPAGLRERFKARLARRVDWWFASTDLSARHVVELGFDADHVTAVNNAVDTSELQASCAVVSDADVTALRARWQLGDGPIGLFIGSLYADNRIDFLIAAAGELVQRVPGFRLIVVGAGPAAGLLRELAATRPWLHAVGARLSHDKAVCLRAARLMLNPGLVGLGILDSFAAGLPLVTTDCGLHSPEIAYLDNGVNGVMTRDNLPAYVQACAHLLSDSAAWQEMAGRALASAGEYTLDDMTERFVLGIQAALQLQARR